MFINELQEFGMKEIPSQLDIIKDGDTFPIMQKSLLIKMFKISFKKVFGSLAFLTTAMAQWSLRSLPKTPASVYLWGAFVIIRSRRDDLEGYLMLGRVGLSINLLRFNESQIDFKPSEADDNQSRFRSPTMTNALQFNSETQLFKELKASPQAEESYNSP